MQDTFERKKLLVSGVLCRRNFLSLLVSALVSPENSESFFMYCVSEYFLSSQCTYKSDNSDDIQSTQI